MNPNEWPLGAVLAEVLDEHWYRDPHQWGYPGSCAGCEWQAPAGVLGPRAAHVRHQVDQLNRVRAQAADHHEEWQ